MKQTYVPGEIEIIKFATNDVIETSGGAQEPEAGWGEIPLG